MIAMPEDAKIIINELIERGDNMTINIGVRTLVWRQKEHAWVVYTGLFITPRSTIFVGEDFWQAFAALCHPMEVNRK